MSGIRVSKEFGLNPSIQVCSCCGEDMGTLLLGTAYKENVKTAKAPMKMATGNICDRCKGVIEQGGVFFIEVRDGEAKLNPKNPYRTGRLVALKKEAVERIFPANSVQSINYMEHSVFDGVFGDCIK